MAYDIGRDGLLGGANLALSANRPLQQSESTKAAIDLALRPAKMTYDFARQYLPGSAGLALPGRRLPLPESGGRDLIAQASDGFAGWSDGLTFGGAQWVREQLGYGEMVNRSSEAYSNGLSLGRIHLALLLRGLGRAAGARGYAGVQSGANWQAAGMATSEYAEWSLKNPRSPLAAGPEAAQWIDIAGRSMQAFGTARLLAPAFGAAAGAVPHGKAILLGYMAGDGGRRLWNWFGKDKSGYGVKDYARDILPELAGLRGGLGERTGRDFSRAHAWGERSIRPYVTHPVGSTAHTHNWLARNTGLDRAAKWAADRLGIDTCFAGDTPLMAEGPDGTLVSLRIDEIREGDFVLSRDESDPNGPCEFKMVEAVFRRLAEVLKVALPGGVVIKTTGEHPFFVAARLCRLAPAHGEAWAAKGGTGGSALLLREACGEWIPARALQPGDVLLSHDGAEVEVQGLSETGLWEPVYNLRVEEYHTYFVGCQEWGFSVWAHNMECGGSNRLARAESLAEQELAELRGTRHVEDVGRVQTAHDAGSQLGRQHAEQHLKLVDEFGWDNPFDHHGRYGQGFDDILVGRRGQIWIVEYKGGEATLSRGQMERAWVQGNIDRLVQGRGLRPEFAADAVSRRYYQEMGEYLQRALDNGELHGVTISTPRLENGLFGPSKVVQRRSPLS